MENFYMFNKFLMSFIIVIDTEGTSVLTAWASDKLTVEKVTEQLKNSGIGQD